MHIRGYLADSEPLPRPKATGKNLIDIPVDADDALKIAAIEAFNSAGISARRLGKGVTEAQRIFDPDHPTKLGTLRAALNLLGKDIVVSVRDAA